MITFVVPAQITTLEDKIAGNLSLTQVMLLLAPFFLATFIYLAIPPQSLLTLQKGLCTGILFIVFVMLAIRIRERTILSWMLLLAGYYLRPHVYVPDKNDLYLRDPVQEKSKPATQLNVLAQKRRQTPLPLLPATKLVALERLLKNPHQSVSFTFKKKGIAHVFDH